MWEQQHGGGGGVGRADHLDEGGGGEEHGRQLDREGGAVDGGAPSHLALQQIDAGGGAPRHLAPPQQAWDGLLQVSSRSVSEDQPETCSG